MGYTTVSFAATSARPASLTAWNPCCAAICPWDPHDDVSVSPHVNIFNLSLESLLNPFLAYSAAMIYGNNPKKVLSPTLGWSSYMIGIMAVSSVKEYIGVDVIPKVCETTRLLAKNLYPKKELL